MCPSICITRHGTESDAASSEISCVVIKSDVFPMLLHYQTDGDRLSVAGRMAGGNRGSKTPLLLWLVNGHVLRTGIDCQGSSGDLNVWGPRAEW